MLAFLKSIYSGKKVFLTGHTGFKGAWLLKLLTMLGAEVKGYALMPDNAFDLYNLINGDHLCESCIADLRNRDVLINAITSFQPDFVFHLAAQPLVRLSYQIPSATFEVNAIGTANVLDGINQLEKPCVAVMITTDKVYYNNEWPYPYRENDRLGGYDPYSASKACAELVIDSYRNSFFNVKDYQRHGKVIAVARAGNVIGGGDWSKDRLIPDIVRFLEKNETIIIRNPDAVRPWEHVLEPITGYLLLGAKAVEEPVKFSEAFNFGPDSKDTLAVEAMVKLAINCWGSGTYKILKETNQPHEAGLLKLDISKTTAQTGWKPKMEANEALTFTIDWYKEYFTDRSNITNYTNAQIQGFLNR